MPLPERDERFYEVLRKREVPYKLIKRLSITPLVKELLVNKTSNPTNIKNLSPKQRLYLEQYSNGMSYPMIAKANGVALGTVQTQLKTARYKLRAKSGPHAVRIAMERGLI